MSAREIARMIGYSPGTLYNIFENIDDVLLTLQAQLLDEVVIAIRTAPASGSPTERIGELARAFVDFALGNRQMWNLLSAHYPENGVKVPQALHDKINELIAIVADALRPLMHGADDQQIDHAARSLWGGVQGLTAIAVTSKGPTLGAGNAHVYVHTLTSTFVRGLARS